MPERNLPASSAVCVRVRELAPERTQVVRLDAHLDYVRAAAGSPSAEHVWATGRHVWGCWDRGAMVHR